MSKVQPLKKKKLTLKQKKFTAEYLKSGNATQAAKKAGYSKKTAAKIGSENLQKPDIKEEIGSAAEKLGIDAQYVLESIKDTMERCKQAKPVLDKKGNQVFVENREGEVVPAYIFNANAVLKGGELLGKHLSMFTEKLEIDTKVEIKENSPDEQLNLARKWAAIFSNPKLNKSK